MTDTKPATAFFGYVSAYLKEQPRTLAEAERDLELQQRLDREARQQLAANAERKITKMRRP